MMQGFIHIFSGFIKKKDQHVASLCFTFLVDTGLSAYAVFFPLIQADFSNLTFIII